MITQSSPTSPGQTLKAIPLPGLTLDTLGLYFAALGLLRLLSRKWPQVRGCWRQGVFTVVGGPEVLDEIAVFLFEIARSNQWTTYEKLWDAPQKADTKAAQMKKPIEAIANWRADTAEDSLLMFTSHLVPGEKRNSFNPLFGTGGNAGKRLFASGWDKARQAIIKPGRGVAPQDLLVDLHAFLTNGSCQILGDFAAGSWFSLANKVFNSGSARPFAEGQVTPWAMLLACEAFPLLSGSATRLLGAHRRQNAAFPFICRAPAPESETACGQWLGDFWAPVWQRPFSLSEVVMIFQSGKAELAGKAALTSAAFAGAIVQRGVDAGLNEFRCFTLQRTTSDNTFESQLTRVISVPSHNPLFSDVFQRMISLRDRLPEDRKQGKSWRFKGLQGPLDRALLALAQAVGEGREETQYEAVLAVLDAAFGALEKVDRNKAHREAKVRFELLPLSFLAWIASQEGGTTEFRLALAVASLKEEIPQALANGKEAARLPQPFLAYRLGAAGKGRYWEIPKDRPLRSVWGPRTLVDNLISLAHRRIIESPSTAIAPFRSRFPAPLPDVLTFLQGGTDDALITRWIDRLSLFHWSDAKASADKLRASLPVMAETLSTVGSEAALYNFFRPLLHEELLRGLTTAGEQWKQRPGQPMLDTTHHIAPVLAALEREDATAAWTAAKSAFHAQRVPVADFGSTPFAANDPRRLLAALILPAEISGIYSYFRSHWQSPSQPQTQSQSI